MAVGLLGCAVEPVSGDALPVVVPGSVDADGSELIVGAYQANELAFAPDFPRELLTERERWVLRGASWEERVDVADAGVTLPRALESGDQLSLVGESGNDETTTLELRIGEADTSAAPAPAPEPASQCSSQCMDVWEGRHLTTACGSCGWDKREYTEQLRQCRRCTHYCFGYSVTLQSCGSWYSTGLVWCDHC